MRAARPAPPDSGWLPGGQGWRLIQGDCGAILPTLPDRGIDVVVTSPPYNLDLRYRSYADNRGEAEYLDWLVGICAELRRVLADDGSFFLNIAGSSTQPWLPFELAVRLRPLFALQNHITWVKSIAANGDAVGHYKPVGGQRFLNRNHEHLFHFTRSGRVQLDRLAIGVPFKDKSNIARRGHARDLRCRGDSWFIPYRTVQSRAQKHHHPAPFPQELPQWCIRLHGKPDALVLDPFAGTGTTLLAARAVGARAIGIELDGEYLQVAADLLSQGVTPSG